MRDFIFSLLNYIYAFTVKGGLAAGARDPLVWDLNVSQLFLKLRACENKLPEMLSDGAAAGEKKEHTA